MPIDPNIALQFQPIQLQNPLDVATKAMSLRDLSQRSQIQNMQMQQQQQSMGDQQALRGSLMKNTVVGPDGSPQINHAGVMSDLSKGGNIQAAADYDKKVRSDKLDELTKQTSIAKDLLWRVPTDAAIPIAEKQAAWDQIRQAGVQAKLPNADNMPQQYPGDDHVKLMQHSVLTAEEQLKQQNSERDFNLKSQENQEKHTENKIKLQELTNTKQSNAVRQIDQMLESARGNKAVNQAESDLYASSKIKGLLAQYPDPNAMPPEMVKLLVSEVGKVAQGGSPTMDELKGLTPNTIFGGRMASATENLMNHPSGANAGAFLKQYSSYADSVAGDAKKLLKDRYGRIIETNKEGLGSKYDSVKKQYLSRFDEPAGGTVQMRDPKGNIREVPSDQVDAAKAAGGVPL